MTESEDELMTEEEDNRTPEQRQRWDQFMEHVTTAPHTIEENADGDLVIDYPRLRATFHIKPRTKAEAITETALA